MDRKPPTPQQRNVTRPCPSSGSLRIALSIAILSHVGPLCPTGVAGPAGVWCAGGGGGRVHGQGGRSSVPMAATVMAREGIVLLEKKQSILSTRVQKGELKLKRATKRAEQQPASGEGAQSTSLRDKDACYSKETRLCFRRSVGVEALCDESSWRRG